MHLAGVCMQQRRRRPRAFALFAESAQELATLLVGAGLTSGKGGKEVREGECVWGRPPSSAQMRVSQIVAKKVYEDLTQD